MTPLSASSTYTQMPLRHPSARVTFEAPGFPEPTVEMSIPFARAISVALGKVPRR